MSSYEAVLSCAIIHFNFTIDWFAATTLPLPLAENDEVTLSLLISSLNFFQLEQFLFNVRTRRDEQP